MRKPCYRTAGNFCLLHRAGHHLLHAPAIRLQLLDVHFGARNVHCAFLDEAPELAWQVRLRSFENTPVESWMGLTKTSGKIKGPSTVSKNPEVWFHRGWAWRDEARGFVLLLISHRKLPFKPLKFNRIRPYLGLLGLFPTNLFSKRSTALNGTKKPRQSPLVFWMQSSTLKRLAISIGGEPHPSRPLRLLPQGPKSKVLARWHLSS